MKNTSALLHEIVGETGDQRLAAIAGEVEYLEVANAQFLRQIMDINEVTKELILRAAEELKNYYTPERYAEAKAVAQERVEAQRDLNSLRELLKDLERAPEDDLDTADEA